MATEKKVKYPWRKAFDVACEIREQLQISCERIEIAGSLRRERPEVGDIELLCVPKTTPIKDMFETETGVHDHLTSLVEHLEAEHYLERRGGMGAKNKLMRHVESGIPVDIFSTSEENWGMALLVRTGSAKFNIRVMSRFKAMGHGGHAYGGITLNQYDIYGSRKDITCPDEQAVFDALEWPFIEPKERS